MGSHVAPNPWRDHGCAYYFASQRRHHAHANIQMAYSILSKPVNICMRSMSPATCDLVGTTVILGPGLSGVFSHVLCLYSLKIRLGTRPQQCGLHGLLMDPASTMGFSRPSAVPLRDRKPLAGFHMCRA